MKRHFVSFALAAIAVSSLSGCGPTVAPSIGALRQSGAQIERHEAALGDAFERIWAQPIRGQPTPPGYVLGDSIYLYSVPGMLIRLQRDGGGVLWVSDITYPLDGRPTRDGEGRLFSMSGGQLLVLEETTGARLARRRVRSGVFESVFPADDGYLTFLGSDSSVHIISSETGFEQILPVRLWGHPLYVNSSSRSMIHMALNDATIAAHFSNTGHQAWRTSLDRNLYAPFGLYGSDIYVGGTNYYLYRISAPTGFIEWRVPVGGVVTQQPKLSNGRVFVVTHDRELHAVSAADGSFLWEDGIPNCHRFLTADDKYVVYEEFGERLAVADVETGEVLGRSQRLSYMTLLAGEEDGFVCMVDWDSNVIGIAPRTPTEDIQWE